MNKELIANLNDLIAIKNERIKGLMISLGMERNRSKKIRRELEYLKAQYDSAVEREVVNRAIELVDKIGE